MRINCPFAYLTYDLECGYKKHEKCEDIECCPKNGDALCAQLIADGVSKRYLDTAPDNEEDSDETSNS